MFFSCSVFVFSCSVLIFVSFSWTAGSILCCEKKLCCKVKMFLVFKRTTVSVTVNTFKYVTVLNIFWGWNVCIYGAFEIPQSSVHLSLLIFRWKIICCCTAAWQLIVCAGLPHSVEQYHYASDFLLDGFPCINATPKWFCTWSKISLEFSLFADSSIQCALFLLISLF